MKESISKLLVDNLDVVFLFYGFAFVVLGISIFIQLRITKKSKFKLLNILPLLAWFGLTHGLNEFVDMFEIIKGDLLLFKVIAPIFLFISYFFIFLFGYQLMSISTKKLRYWLPSLIVVLFLGLPLVVEVADFMNWKISARYFLGFPGAILSSIGLVLYCKSEQKKLEQVQARKYFLSAAIFFGVYGILGGLIVPKAGFFPASMFNNDSFIAFAGVPVQFFRAICAIGIAWSMWHIIDIFNVEELIVKESLIDKLKKAKINLDSKVKERTKELSQTNKLLKKEISDRKNLEEKLEYLALHDPLTNLTNRRLFDNRLKQAMFAADRTQGMLALLYLDIDDLKQINDMLGHEIGDLLLMNLAKRLQECVRKMDTVARIGGDEFAIMLSTIRDRSDIVKVAEKILSRFVEPFLIKKHKIFSSASIGISVYPFDSKELDALLSNADIAMYQAKINGKNKYRFYDETMKQKAA